MAIATLHILGPLASLFRFAVSPFAVEVRSHGNTIAELHQKRDAEAEAENHRLQAQIAKPSDNQSL